NSRGEAGAQILGADCEGLGTTGGAGQANAPTLGGGREHSSRIVWCCLFFRRVLLNQFVCEPLVLPGKLQQLFAPRIIQLVAGGLVQLSRQRAVVLGPRKLVLHAGQPPSRHSRHAPSIPRKQGYTRKAPCPRPFGARPPASMPRPLL